MSQSLHERMMKMHGGADEGDQAMQKASYTVALKTKKEIAKGTMAFTFQKPKDMQFIAGQHIRMTLIDPSETDEEGDSRFFSIASSPSEPDLLIAMRMRDTAFKRIISKLLIGEKVLIQIRLHSHEKAFILHKDTAKSAVFLAGGIGIVPVYSIIKDWAERKLRHKITLFYANRSPEDAPFLTELQKLAKQNPAFTLIATMTEPEKSAQVWRGETGRIDKAMLEKYVSNVKDSIHYVAGLSDLVNTMQQLLAAEGVSEDDIRAEEWGNFTMAHGKQSQARSKTLVLVISVVVLAMLALHVAAASRITTIIGPLLYLLLVVAALVVTFKLKLLTSFIKGKRGQ